MEAIFIVPAMVSPNVNPRLVPAISKLIERNIIMMNSSVFRAAALQKYSGFFKTARSESVEDVADLELLNEKSKEQEQSDTMATAIGSAYGAYEKTLTKSAEKDSKSTFVEPTKIEVPSDIQFFSTISLEPTALKIPVIIKSGLFGGESSRVITIGVKCTPYTVTGVDSLISMMHYIKSLTMLKRYFFRQWNNIKGKIPFTAERAVRTGSRSAEGAGTDVVFSPNSSELSKSSTVKKLMSANTATYWSTLSVLSTVDFQENDLKTMLASYRDLVKGGWGDMVVVNDARESIHFCTAKMMACYEWPMAYLKQILNLTNVLDYSEISRWTKPFSVGPIANILRDGYSEITPSEEVNSKMLTILRG